ncbi:MAG: HPF/RaiA family ribosome-associated protein [Nitrospirae bacterium]|nr:MAG: HPF/RaiA family ribosome-associated protein [Nitrospirota bacterium]
MKGDKQQRTMDLEIESRNVGMTPRWKEEIEARMADLQEGHNDLIHGRVTLTKNPHHKKANNVAEALVVVTLPGRHTITARKERKTFEEAIRAAFAAVETELDRYRQKRASKEIRTSPIPPYTGVVSKLFPDEGYGFILLDGGEEVYFHRNAVHGMKFEELVDGTEVVLNVEEGEKGLQATTVNPPPMLP